MHGPTNVKKKKPMKLEKPRCRTKNKSITNSGRRLATVIDGFRGCPPVPEEKCSNSNLQQGRIACPYFNSSHPIIEYGTV